MERDLGSVASTACLVVVGSSWALCWVFLALGFGISRMPVAAGGAVAVSFFGTVIACRLGARMQRRLSMPWWPLVTAVLGASSIAIAYCLLWSRGLVNHRLSGPTSPSGLTTTIVVHDAGLGWSADFYTDVSVVDARGNIVAEWKDPWGQFPSDGPRLLRDSMRWTSPDTLEFRTRDGAQYLTIR